MVKVEKTIEIYCDVESSHQLHARITEGLLTIQIVDDVKCEEAIEWLEKILDLCFEQIGWKKTRTGHTKASVSLYPEEGSK